MAKEVSYLPAGYEEGLEDDDNIAEHLERQLKISVAPDKTKGAGLHGKDFDASLDSKVNAIMDTVIHDFGTYHNEPVIKSQLQNLLSNNSEPHKLALKLYLKCPQTNRNSLAGIVMNALKSLYKEKPEIEKLCDDNTRMVAFNLFKCSKPKNIDLIVQTYDLHRITHFIVPKLKEIIQDGDYKLAAKWAIVLHVTKEFGILDIVFPLLLQNSNYVAFEYLTETPSLQIPTAQFLDSLLDRKKTPIQKCVGVLDVYNYKNISMYNLRQTRPLSKLLSAVCKHFKISESYVPNQVFLHTLSYFRHLFNEYLRGHTSVEAFKELIIEAATTRALQMAFIEDICDMDHIDEALFWCEEFKISIHMYPYKVQRERQKYYSNVNSRNRPYLPQQHRQQTVQRDKYLTLDLNNDNILFVDNDTDFRYMVSYLKERSVIGFDSEWKPVWSTSEQSVISLLQFASQERIFLVDCLVKDIKTDLWKLLEKQVFNNPDILKLGFAIGFDLKMLSSSLPLKFNQRKSEYLDLMDLYRYLKNLNIVFPYESNENSSGLSGLASVCLGKPLNKTNQVSNWTRRPLRQEQISYAAMDAYCLLKIFNVIENLLNDKQMDINDIIEDLNYGQKKPNKEKINNGNSSSNSVNKASSKKKSRKRRKT